MVLSKSELEHHRFGPWLIEIKKSEDIPPQYKDVETNILSAKYAFKVPINKDRTSTKPGNLLYDMVVCIDKVEIRVYKHKDKTQSIQQISIADIKYITVTSNLLSNSIEVHSDTHIIKVPYNSISEPVANKAIELLRDNLFMDNSSLKKNTMPVNKVSPSLLISNLLIAEQIYTPSMLLTYEAETKILPMEVSNWDKITLTYNPYQVQESASILNSKELVIINRTDQLKRRKDVDYGYRINYIPLTSISKLAIEPSASFKDVMTVKVHCGNDLVESYVTNRFNFKAFKEGVSKSK